MPGKLVRVASVVTLRAPQYIAGLHGYRGDSHILMQKHAKLSVT